MNPGIEKGYALDYLEAIRHVVHELERAAPVALSDLAKTYTHTLRADLTRVKLHHGLETDLEAEEFLTQRAVDDLIEAGQVQWTNHGYVLAVPFEEVQFDGVRLAEEEENPHARLRDPFNPLSGKFSDNIRDTNAYIRPTDLDTDLEESMKAFGWIPELPAIRDERGVILMGTVAWPWPRSWGPSRSSRTWSSARATRPTPVASPSPSPPTSGLP